MNLSQMPEITGDLYTTNDALDEIKSIQSTLIIDLFLQTYKVNILEPTISEIDQIRSTAKTIGQNNLSLVDIEVLALILMLSFEGETILVTDDYAMRNICHELGLKSQGVKTTGGKQRRVYYFKCKSCGKKITNKLIDCEICGSTEFIRLRKY